MHIWLRKYTTRLIQSSNCILAGLNVALMAQYCTSIAAHRCAIWVVRKNLLIPSDLRPSCLCQLSLLTLHAKIAWISLTKHPSCHSSHHFLWQSYATAHSNQCLSNHQEHFSNHIAMPWHPQHPCILCHQAALRKCDNLVFVCWVLSRTYGNIILSGESLLLRTVNNIWISKLSVDNSQRVWFSMPKHTAVMCLERLLLLRLV